MVQRLNRREALIRTACGAAGALLLPRSTPAGSELKLDDLEELAVRIRSAAADEVFDDAADMIRAGADYKTLLGAVFLAGIHDIRPQQVGGKLHAVMMVESAFQLSEVSAPRDALLAAFWNLDDFKRSQELDRREEGDWVLSAPPKAEFASEKQARREFITAMDAWDAERADRAIVGLLRHHRRDSLFEILWPLAARCYVNIGHKMIYAVQVERVLRRIDWRYAEPVLRSLVNGLLFARSDGPQMQAFAASLDLAASLPSGWMDGRDDPPESAALLKELRGCTSEQAQKLVVSRLTDGLGAQTVWDGLRLFASELFLRRRGSSPSTREALLPVHSVTVINALGHAWRTTNSDSTRKLLLLQAAGWLPLLQRDLAAFVGLATDGPGIDALGATARESDPSTLDDLLEDGSPPSARSFLDEQPQQRPTYLARLRQNLIRTAVEHHQFKYAAAIHEESRMVDPAWASRILAPAIPYLPKGPEPATDVFDRSVSALRAAGVE